VAVLFALPPLTALWRVSPARVLRADAEPLPAPTAVRWTVGILLVGGLFAASWAQARDLKLAAAFTGALFVTGGVLALGAKFAMWATAHLPRRGLGPYLAHGLAAMGRPAAGTTGAIVALGLGVLTVMGMYLVETRLDRGLRNAVPPDAPSAFMVDIQPDQWEGVRELLQDEGAIGVQSVPVVMARLGEIDGESVVERAKSAKARGEKGRSRWVLTREQRLTWSAELPKDNVIVEGELWSDPDRAEVSIEKEFAEDLGVGVGSTIVVDVQGVPVELLVSSIRTVEWQTFGINFFLVVEPGVLDDAPQFRIAVARLEEGADQKAQDRLAAAFPNVTLFQVRPIVDRVAGLLRRIAAAVRLLGAFTIVAGIVILAGAVSATTLRRSREAALLKTLGITRVGVARLLAAEYGACGLVAGLLGGLGALALSWGFLEKVAELPADLPVLGLPLAAVLTAVGTALFGVLASGRALAVRPMEALR
ncbi:MAG: ABC transporter permease, partial [Planctomycetota bacterium]